MKTQVFDIAIIGGGAAGLTAAVYGARANKSVAVFEKMLTGGQLNLARKIENYPGVGSTSGPILADAFLSKAVDAGAQILYEQVVSVSVAADSRFLIKTLTAEYVAKSVIAASGLVPKKLDIAREDELRGSGVSYCAYCDGAFFKNKSVAVYGSTLAAYEDAEYLTSLAKTVYHIAGSKLRDVKGAVKIENAKITALNGFPLKSVTLESDCKLSQIEVSGLFIAAGNRPDASFLQGVSTDGAGFIIADGGLKTNVPGIFAAGDARKKTLRQVVTAASDGAEAATEAIKWLALRQNRAAKGVDSDD